MSALIGSCVKGYSPRVRRSARGLKRSLSFSFTARSKRRLRPHTHKASSSSLVGRLLHAVSEAQRAHVSPHLLDVVQTLCLASLLGCILPPKSILPVRRPDGILLFII